MKKTYIILAVVAVVALYVLTGYNRIVTTNEVVTNQWAQVETQYQRRFDLIPNLVASVQGIMKQEKEVFGALAEARSKYAGAQGVDARAQAAGQVESAFARLLVITENYPQLKSSESVQALMTELEGSENRVSVERKRFNDAVQGYNLLTKRFPMSIIARVFGFGAHPYFEATEGSAVAPKVNI
jgi:LemA protein